MVSAVNVKRFIKESGFLGPLQVASAKAGEGCDDLLEAILQAVDWKSIPETTLPALYHRLKQGILDLRESGPVQIRLAESKQRLELTRRGENLEPAELETAVGLLAGPDPALDFPSPAGQKPIPNQLNPSSFPVRGR